MVDYTHNKRFGDFGEEYVKGILIGLGMRCGYSSQADLKTGQVTLEVKISKLSQHDLKHKPRFQFCLWREGHTYFNADFLICLCCPDGQRVTDSYIIPAERVDHKRKLRISAGDYRGKWLPFHDAWNLITAHPGVEWRNNA